MMNPKMIVAILLCGLAGVGLSGEVWADFIVPDLWERLTVTAAPENPTPDTPVTITVGVLLPDPCYDMVGYDQWRVGSSIILDIKVYRDPMAICPFVMTWREWTFELGTLPAGRHTVDAVLCEMGIYGWCGSGRLSFTIDEPPVSVDPDPDANGDCSVNILDLLFVWHCLFEDPASGDCSSADVNKDGKVDILDMIFVRNHIGEKCEE